MRTAALVTLVALALAPAAHAEGDDGPQPVRVTTFLLPHPGVDDEPVAAVMQALEDGLKQNPRLDMKSLDSRLADFAQEIPQADIDQGRKLLTEGQQALVALELGTAIRKLSQSVELLSRVLPFVKKQELADAQMALGVAYHEQGNTRESHAIFVKLLTWRSDYKVDTNRYPPQFIGVIAEERRELERGRRGSLEIRSEPQGAQAYVDGRYIGVTPATAEGLIAGEHYVTLKKEGYKKTVMPAAVSSRAQQTVSVPLEKSPKYLLVQQAIGSVQKDVGAATLGRDAENLREVLLADHGVFVRAQPQSGAGYIKADAWLYDLRTRRRLTHATKVVQVATAQKQLGDLATALYEGVSYDADLQAPKDAPPPKPYVRKPFYKTWWFWTTAAVVTAGVVVGAVVGTEVQPKTCGAGNACLGITF